MRKHYLNKVLEPQSVAVVGASDRELSVGAQVLSNIRNGGFAGEIYPVNPKYDKVQGLQCYASVKDIDHPVDLVVITIPASAIPEIMRQCGDHGQELDINPLLVDEHDVTAVDARIVVGAAQTNTSHYGHMAIHPYPPELESIWHLSDGTDVMVRPIRPEDAAIEQEFVDNLSAESKYFRFMNRMDKLTPLMLARFTQIDYDREMALIAVTREHTAQARIPGVARYIGNPDGQSCEFALAIADSWQKRGIGRHLMERLMTVAHDRGLEIMEGDVLSQNAKMLRLCKNLGFRVVHDSEDPEVAIVRRHL